MKKILILNILLGNDKKNSFNRRMKEVFFEGKISYTIIYIEDLYHFDEFEGFSHLLISGSEGSAYDEKNWYVELEEIILKFKADNKPILGICFAHQFLIRILMGKKNVRRSETPELGWIQVKLKKNLLFEGIKDFKSAVFHHDEVFDLDDRFKIIAESDRCKIQGFQFSGLLIWGIQFHPDFMYDDVYKFIRQEKNKGVNPDSCYMECPIKVEEFKSNDKIFLNWFESEKKER